MKSNTKTYFVPSIYLIVKTLVDLQLKCMTDVRRSDRNTTAF